MPRLLKNKRKILCKRKNGKKSPNISSSNLKKKKTSKEVNIPQISSAYPDWLKQETLRMTIYMMYVEKYEHAPPMEWGGHDGVVSKIHNDLCCVRKDTIMSFLNNIYHNGVSSVFRKDI